MQYSKKMIVKRNSNYLIRKLFQDQNEGGGDDDDDFEEVTIEKTKLVEVTQNPVIQTGTTDSVIKNITSTINPLSTSTTMSGFEKNKEMIEEAAKKLKSKSSI